MTAFEWFPWFPALYRADTMHLTAEQDGIYRRLIDHYMETRRPLPESLFALARIAGVDQECFGYAWSMLQAFFTHQPGIGYTHKRCEMTLAEQHERHQKAQEKARIAATKRWAKYQKDKGSMLQAYSEHAKSNAHAMLGNAKRKEKIGKKRKTLGRSNTDTYNPIVTVEPVETVDKSSERKAGKEVEQYNPCESPVNSDAFRLFVSGYPPTSSPVDNISVAWQRAIDYGEDPNRIIRAALRYRAACAATGQKPVSPVVWLNNALYDDSGPE